MNQTNGANEVAAQGRKELESSAAWQETERDFLATGNAAAVQRTLAQTVERFAVEAFQASLTPAATGAVAMLAVGGFARGELFPYSNPELVIVREGDAPPNFNEGIAEFVRLLWARGVRPGLRVCTLAECVAVPGENVDLSIRLRDRRRLSGDSALAERLDGELTALYRKHGQQMVRRLNSLTRTRHGKYQNTPSHREPDVKEAPGGLRDLRLLANLETLWPTPMNSNGRLAEAAPFLSFVRCFLHYRTRENHNLLDLASQEAIARQFGRGATPSLWMREYFRLARSVFNEMRRTLDSYETSAPSLVEAAGDWQSRLSNAEFTVLHGRVYLRQPANFAQEPEAVFRLLEFVARHGIPAAPETEQRLQAARATVAAYCSRELPLWPAIKTILTLPHAPLAFRLLHYADVLPAIFPEWARIEGMAIHEPDHAYTIDEHALIAMERICNLREANDPARQRFSELFSEIEDQAVLFFALLFHHTGENAEGLDRRRTAAVLGRAAAARTQMPVSDQDLVAFLIEGQTALWDVVTGRDLDNPATVRSLAERIGTVERLRLLAVLTYAEITATSSEVMIPWRLEQLSRTYVAAHRELTRELETDRIHELPAALPESAEFIKGFPTRYLRARTAKEIAAHTDLYQRSRPTGVAVELEPSEGAYRLSVVAQDRPALFASFAGAIASFGLSIVKAEAFSNSQGVILDTFVFVDPKRTLALNPPEAERLHDLIGRVALGKTEARRLFRNRVRTSPERPSIEPQVQFDSEACETATLVEIIAEDRPGLLYSLATVLSSNACNIDTVLIDTKGRRAIDVFYVAQHGKKLSPDTEAALEQQLLSACLGTDTGS